MQAKDLILFSLIKCTIETVVNDNRDKGSLPILILGNNFKNILPNPITTIEPQDQKIMKYMHFSSKGFIYHDRNNSKINPYNFYWANFTAIVS